jgi:hypothetical protein
MSGKTPWHAYEAGPQESTDALYRERAHLVAFLSSTWPACIGPAHDVDEKGWAIVCVDSPAGQMTWHIAPRDLDLFGHLRIANAEWDGHSTAEKYQRLDKLTQRQAANSVAPELAAAMAESRELRAMLADVGRLCESSLNLPGIMVDGKGLARRVLAIVNRAGVTPAAREAAAERPVADVHRWYAVVKHCGSFAYGFAATSDGLRVWDDASEFEHAREADFE